MAHTCTSASTQFLHYASDEIVKDKKSNRGEP